MSTEAEREAEKAAMLEWERKRIATLAIPTSDEVSSCGKL
jgi:hypothetical protein